jgi:hypothetical protein
VPARGIPFRKRATVREDVREDAAATGTANASPSISSLQAEVSTIHRRLRELTRDREQLALPSLRGDTQALTDIAEIDAARRELLARKETAEAAIRALQTEARAVGWKHFLPHLRRCFRAEISSQWELWPRRIEQLMLGRQSHDIVALREAIKEIEGLEASTARLVVDRHLPEPRVFYRNGDQGDLVRARQEKAKLIEQRRQAVADAAAELLSDAANLKRPKVLDEWLASARRRLEVETAPHKRLGGRW